MSLVPKDMDDMWVCNYCGSEDVRTEVFVDVNTEEIVSSVTNNDYYFCDTCGDDTQPLTYFEFKEKIAEECGGNKDKYDKIMDGSRMWKVEIT
mgnify:CR=1 FL=1